MKKKSQQIASVNTLANLIQLASRSTQGLVGVLSTNGISEHAETDALNELTVAQLRKTMTLRGMIK